MENNQMNTKNNSKIIIVIMALIIVGLAGYIVYDKFIQKDITTESQVTNTKEKDCNCPKCEECVKCENNASQCNCSNTSTSCLGEKITSVKVINLKTTNQEIKIGKKTYKIKKDNEDKLYVNDQEVNVNNDAYAPFAVYLTDKYLFATTAGQFYESINYALGEQGEIGVNNGEFTMQNFKVVNGYLHALGGKIVFGGYDLGVDMEDLLIKFSDNTLIVTYAK